MVPPSRPSDPARVMDYGTCTWDATHRKGARINEAHLPVAPVRGGATVVVPAGIYGQSTPIVQPTNGVHLVGAGLGWVKEHLDPRELCGHHAAGVVSGPPAPPPASVEPASCSCRRSIRLDVDGIVFDCVSRPAMFGSRFRRPLPLCSASACPSAQHRRMVDHITDN